IGAATEINVRHNTIVVNRQGTRHQGLPARLDQSTHHALGNLGSETISRSLHRLRPVLLHADQLIILTKTLLKRNRSQRSNLLYQASSPTDLRLTIERPERRNILHLLVNIPLEAHISGANGREHVRQSARGRIKLRSSLTRKPGQLRRANNISPQCHLDQAPLFPPTYTNAPGSAGTVKVSTGRF